MDNREVIERAIESKSFLRKDVLGGNYIDFPVSHGKLVLYAIDNNIKFKQHKSHKESKTFFVTELLFDSIEHSRAFYENIDNILKQINSSL